MRGLLPPDPDQAAWLERQRRNRAEQRAAERAEAAANPRLSAVWACPGCRGERRTAGAFPICPNCGLRMTVGRIEEL